MSVIKEKVLFWIIVLADGTPKSWTYATKGEAEKALQGRIDNPLGDVNIWKTARILPAFVDISKR
jgi:hypothetical protein